jgi:hypothetical protein
MFFASRPDWRFSASPVARAFFGEVDPVRREKMRHSKEESRFHDNGKRV